MGSGKTLNVSAGTLTLADDQISGDKINGGTITSTFTGNLTGNTSGTAATVTGAAQSAITSVGTLTGLTTSGPVIGPSGTNAAPTFSFSSDTNTGILQPGSDILAISTAGAERFRITSAGDVGIGTTAPGAFGGTTLQVHHASTYSALLVSSNDHVLQLLASDTHGAQSMGTRSNHDLNLTANDSVKMTVKPDGKIGIGTTAPDSLVEISSGAATTTKISSTSSSSYAELVFEDGVAGYGFQVRSDGAPGAAGSMVINDRDTGSFPVVINEGNASNTLVLSSSKVGVGVTAPNASVDVNGDIKSRSGIQTNQTSSCAFGYQFNGWRAVSWGADDSTRGIYRFEQYEGVDYGGAITSQSASTAGVWSADYTDTSDRNLKKNIVPISTAVDVVKALNPVNFDWKLEAKGSNSGFIAQDLELVLPDEVSGTEYDDTSEFPDTAMSINVTGIVAHLTRALQESMEKIETLEARVAALEGA